MISDNNVKLNLFLWWNFSQDLSILCQRTGTNWLSLPQEANNLTNLSTFRYSGLVQKKTLAIKAADKKGFTVTMNKGKLQQRPAQNKVSVTFKAGPRRSLKKLKHLLVGNKYRNDLKQVSRFWFVVFNPMSRMMIYNYILPRSLNRLDEHFYSEWFIEAFWRSEMKQPLTCLSLPGCPKESFCSIEIPASSQAS